MKKRIFRGEEYCEVHPDFMIALLQSGPAPNYSPRGRFLAQDPETGMWCAVDNETGDAWTEEFFSRYVALQWLCTTVYHDTEYAHQIDRRAKQQSLAARDKEKQWRPS